jgi:predicted metal-binding membrane protein
MSAVELRTTVLIVGLLVTLAAVAWAVTARQALGMDGMAPGIATANADMAMSLSAPLFLGMWLAMMSAMMLPTVAPMVLAHRMVVRRRNEGALPTIAFIGGYLLVWTAVGVIPLAGLAAARRLLSAASSRELALIAGAVLIVAGAYQFTAWKSRCLRACRSPMSFLVTHDFRTGSRGALRAGISHGAWCLGCCWALMAVLVTVGVMNLVWMAAIALVFLAEKNWGRGAVVPQVVGTGVILIGAATMVWPRLLVAAPGGM